MIASTSSSGSTTRMTSPTSTASAPAAGAASEPLASRSLIVGCPRTESRPPAPRRGGRAPRPGGGPADRSSSAARERNRARRRLGARAGAAVLPVGLDPDHAVGLADLPLLDVERVEAVVVVVRVQRVLVVDGRR